VAESKCRHSQRIQIVGLEQPCLGNYEFKMLKSGNCAPRIFFDR
jgi:hypothetical protein